MTSVFHEETCWENLHFARHHRKSYNSTNDLNLLTVFRKNESKYFWVCAACNSRTNCFKNLLSLRLFALDHLRSSHSEENSDIEKIVEEEWKLIKEETKFDVEKLMEISRKRRDIKNQSRRKFYFTNLRCFENGQHFEEYLKNNYYKNDEKEDEQREKDYRFCLICLELVEKSEIDQHFRGKIHSEVESHSHISTFFELPSSVITKDFYDSDLAFPKDIFAYCTVYKTLRRDMFKWRCCLCPNTHAHTFVTFIVLRMYALRHIEENHQYLFREQFLESEWNIIQYELQIGFDIQNYRPTLYTIRGENSFNVHNPNDFTLPQQYFFIPEEFVKYYSICGFCFKSLHNREFIRHIVSHGFVVEQNETQMLKRAETSPRVEELMEPTNQFDAQKLDEPVQMLTFEGKQLKAKIDQISENASSISNCSTPTQKKRKSAMDAKELLSKTFEILKENFKEISRTWDDPMNSHSSCSSSSEEESSNDEYKASKTENRNFRRNRKMLANCIKTDIDDNSQLVLKWIQEQALKRGLDCNFNKDSSDEEDTGIVIKDEFAEKQVQEELPEEEKIVVMPRPTFVEPEQRQKVLKKRVRFDKSTKKASPSTEKSDSNIVLLQGNSKYSSMTPIQIRELIKNAAKERGINIASTSSESDSDDNLAVAPQSDSIFDKMSPDQIRLYLKIQATQRGIQNGFVNSSSDSSDEEEEEEEQKIVVRPTVRQTRKRKCRR